VMRSRSSDRSLGTAYTSGLSKSYGGGLNSRPGGRQAERYICKSNYGGTRYRTRSGYDPDYMPRYNTFSGYRNRDRQAYSSAGNYSSYRDRTRSAPPPRRYRSRSEDPTVHRRRERTSASPWRERSYYSSQDAYREHTDYYGEKTRPRYSEKARYSLNREYKPQRDYARPIYTEPKRYLPT